MERVSYPSGLSAGGLKNRKIMKKYRIKNGFQIKTWMRGLKIMHSKDLLKNFPLSSLIPSLPHDHLQILPFPRPF